MIIDFGILKEEIEKKEKKDGTEIKGVVLNFELKKEGGSKIYCNDLDAHFVLVNGVDGVQILRRDSI